MRQRLDVESLIENIPSSLETKTPWWWARSPGPAGGTPGTWSQRSPRLCSTAKVYEYSSTLILHQRGAQTSSPRVGLRLACASKHDNALQVADVANVEGLQDTDYIRRTLLRWAMCLSGMWRETVLLSIPGYNESFPWAVFFSDWYW